MRKASAERNGRILEARLAGRRLDDIGREYGLTAERIRQICTETQADRTRRMARDLRQEGYSKQQCIGELLYECLAAGVGRRLLECIVEMAYTE